MNNLTPSGTCQHGVRRRIHRCLDCERTHRWPTTIPPDPEFPSMPRLATWHTVRDLYGAEQATVALELYSGHPEYAIRLFELAAVHDMVLTDGRRGCYQKLVNPRHRCTGLGCGKYEPDPRGIDHPVWFRRGTEQWALLSTEYSAVHRVHPIDCQQVVHLPISPYSEATCATLYLGFDTAHPGRVEAANHA